MRRSDILKHEKILNFFVISLESHQIFNVEDPITTNLFFKKFEGFRICSQKYLTLTCSHRKHIDNPLRDLKWSVLLK